MIKENIFCGLDIGSQRIKACILRSQKNQEIELLGISQLETRGLDKSSVSDLKDLSDCIHSILSGLASKARVKVKNLNVGIGGHFVKSKAVEAVIPLVDKGNKIISAFDIKKINRQVSLLGIDLDEQICHNFSTRYVVDGFNVSTNPLGLHGRKLESDALLIVAKNNLIHNINKAVNQAGFEVANIFFSTLCAAQACLSQKERKDGCIFMNIGTNATDILVFKDDMIKSVCIIPCGGNNLTDEISRSMKLPFDLAEDIKQSYAIVPDSEDVITRGEILVKRDVGYTPIERHDICKTIFSSVTNLFSKMCDIMRDSHAENRLSGGIIVSGGGSLLPGLIEYLEKNSGLHARIGKIGIKSRRLSSPALYAAAIGLAQNGFSNSFNTISSSGRGVLILKHFLSRIGEIYQEYF